MMARMFEDQFDRSNPSAQGPPVNAARRVYADLRRRIIRLELAPHTVLVRAQLAEEYAVSQTPVREALQRLEFEGLVKVFPQSRTIVVRIDEAQLEEALFHRLSLEVEVARRLAALKSRDALAELRRMLAEHRALPEDTDFAAFDRLDRAFHREMFLVLGLRNTYSALLIGLGHLNRCDHLLPFTRSRREGVLGEHVAIYTAVSSGDREAAAAAVRTHIERKLDEIATLRRAFPGYFAAND